MHGIFSRNNQIQSHFSELSVAELRALNLDREGLLTKAKQHPLTARNILVTPELLNTVAQSDDFNSTLSAIACAHPESAKFILETKNLREQLFGRSRYISAETNTSLNLSFIADSHPDSAVYILKSAELYEKMTRSDDESLVRAKLADLRRRFGYLAEVTDLCDGKLRCLSSHRLRG